MHGNTSAAAEFTALRQKAFAGVALAGELFMFAPELVPEGIEGFVVGAVDVMAQSVE